MAKANSKLSTVTIEGITFGIEEVFGPSTLAAMFGTPLPSCLRIDRTGAVPVLQVAQLLQKLGHQAVAALEDHSEIVHPSSPGAFANF